MVFTESGSWKKAFEQELKAKLLEVWSEIVNEEIRKQVESITRRLVDL